MLTIEEKEAVKNLINELELKPLIKEGNWPEIWDIISSAWFGHDTIALFITSIAEAGIKLSSDQASNPFNYIDFTDSDITKISIPEGIRILPYEIFMGCESLTEVYFPTTLFTIEHDCFTRCYSVERIDLSKTSVTEIKYGAFSDCNELMEIKLPNSLKHIGEYTFSATALSSIEIPSSVTTIDNDALSDVDCAEITIPAKFKDRIYDIIGLTTDTRNIDEISDTEWEIHWGSYDPRIGANNSKANTITVHFN